MEFLHLGNAVKILGPFSSLAKKAPLLTIKPTLSPKDPNFPTWWEEHKAEWEAPKKEAPEGPAGQEPGDD